jgi:hypothetical protein
MRTVFIELNPLKSRPINSRLKLPLGGQMRKQKNAVSRRGRPATGHKLSGTEQRFHREYPGQEPRIVEHPGPVLVQNAQDSDSGKSEQLLSNHKYPPPKQHPVFQKIWFESIDNVTARENFKISHLNSLRILCDLFVEYEELTQFIEKNGRSYKSTGRSGVVWRLYPEVGQIKSVQAQIREYTKMMGLLLKKDNTVELNDDDDEWT